MIPLMTLGLALCYGDTEPVAGLSGRWVLVSVESAGQKVLVQKALAKGMAFRFVRSELVWEDPTAAPDKQEQITFKTRSDAAPKEIDVTFVRAPGTVVDGKTLLGIYSIEGDTLRICWSHKEGRRPKEFTGRKEPTLFILKRDKD
jgi:uncharacterized protein (TIGR03067 family)